MLNAYLLVAVIAIIVGRLMSEKAGKKTAKALVFAPIMLGIIWLPALIYGIIDAVQNSWMKKRIRVSKTRDGVLVFTHYDVHVRNGVYQKAMFKDGQYYWALQPGDLAAAVTKEAYATKFTYCIGKVNEECQLTMEEVSYDEFFKRLPWMGVNARRVFLHGVDPTVAKNMK